MPEPPPDSRLADLTDADREAIDWLVRLQDTPDDPELRRTFEEWRRDDDNIRAWNALDRTSATFRVIGEQRVARRRQVIAIGAGIVAVLTVAFTPIMSDRWRADATSGTGETRHLALADGSTVVLAPRSMIAVDDDRRIRLLRGAAFFDVVHDPRRRFQVSAAGTTTTVLGTAFEVRGEQEGGATVSVARGAVRVACDDAPGATPVVPAGTSLDLVCGGAVRRARLPADQVALWREGRFAARDVSLRTVIDALRPWYRGTIVVHGDGIDRVRVTGIYDLRDPDRALAALADTGHAEVRRITPWLRIVSAD